MPGPAYEDQDLLFSDALGAPLSPSSVSRTFVRHREAAKIPVGTIHVLRHTAATIGLTRGIALHVVAARLGDDPKTVLATYAHLLPTSDQQAADVIAAVIVDKSLTSAAISEHENLD